MPPALSEDESDLDIPLPVRPWNRSPSIIGAEDDDEDEGDNASVEHTKPIDVNPPARGGAAQDDEDDDDDDDDDDDEDLDEDVFIVETIKKHMVDEDGSLKFQVKWEGYESKKDLTWEPEENLKESAHEILNAYFESVGGRDKIFEESENAAKSKKRSRASNGPTNGASKRSKKTGTHPSSTAPPATSAKWSPPAGSWEDEIDTIDACEDGGSGKLIVYLIWKNGKKTKHETSVIYKKCPQKMLQFYERHVKIIKDENKALVDGVE